MMYELGVIERSVTLSGGIPFSWELELFLSAVR